MPTASPASRDRRLVRRTFLGWAAAVAIAGGAFAVAVTQGHERTAGSPADTVRGFLVAAVVDGNSPFACNYLTPRAVSAFRSVEPRATSCDEALTRARLVLGGKRIEDQAAVKGLRYRVEQRGGRARVTVSAHGAARTFVLRRATSEERAETEAPRTSWRIDAGIDPLLVA